MTKRKYSRPVELPKNPAFIPACHPYSRTEYSIIWADTIPEKAIAIIGRCHACCGIQAQKFEIAANVSPMELIKRFHGNSQTLLFEEDIPSVLIDKNKPIGQIDNPVTPKETAVAVVELPEEPQRKEKLPYADN